MKRDSWPVAEDSVRPRGEPDECFYCQEPIGEEHKIGCVIRQRTVVVNVTFQLVREVPEDWDPEMVVFHLAESSFCASNLLDELHRLDDLGCLCPHVENVEFIREATPEDEAKCRIAEAR